MRSLWQERTELPRFPRAGGDIKTDVLVIGGGMAGLLTAFLLRESGARVTVVERDRIFSGQSGRTTAKITFQHGLIYHRIASLRSDGAARAYLDANRAALGEYERLAAGIDCSFEKRDNYIYTLADRAVLEKEAETLRRIGYSARLTDTPELPFRTAGAVCFPDQAQFDPVKFIRGIVPGLDIREKTPVRAMEGKVAVTDSGKIFADRVVVASHYPFVNSHGAYFLKMYQHRSYVLALGDAPAVSGMYADDAEKGLSFREADGALLLGGGGGRTGKRMGGWDELERFAHRFYPGSEIRCRWAAQDAITPDGMPFAGRYSGSTPDTFVATGFNKWGMTGSMTAAMILRDLILGKTNGYAALFSPSRDVLTARFFANAAESAAGYLYPTAKRCPHLGCALRRNEEEGSWDCPCHGSRFADDGKLLDGPATGDLR